MFVGYFGQPRLSSVCENRTATLKMAKGSLEHGCEKLVLASLAGGVLLFATGFVFYGVLLRDFMEANSPAGLMKAQPDMTPLIIGEIIFGMFLTLILSRWSGMGSFAEGRRRGRCWAYCWG